MKKLLPFFIAVLFLGVSHHAFAYSFFQSVTVDHTKVPNTDQTNFPILVSGTYANLKTVGNGGFVQNSSGFDVGFFTSNTCASGKLNWETEKYVATTGEVDYWINIASLSHTTDTVIYMCYGDASITTDQSNKTAVWDSNYLFVQHLPDGTTLTANDSTSNGKNGTLVNTPTAAAGQIDGAANFNGTNQSISMPTMSTGLSSSFTFDAWVKPNGATTVNGVMVSEVNSGYTNYFAFLGIGGTGTYGMSLFDGANNPEARALVAPTTGVWAHIVGVRDIASATVKVYVNGVLGASVTDTAGLPTYGDFNIGRQLNIANRLFPGVIDESRVSGVARSADYIATEYNAELIPDKAASSTGGFYTLGTKTSTGGATASLLPRLILLAGRMMILSGRVLIN